MLEFIVSRIKMQLHNKCVYIYMLEGLNYLSRLTLVQHDGVSIIIEKHIQRVSVLIIMVNYHEAVLEVNGYLYHYRSTASFNMCCW